MSDHDRGAYTPPTDAPLSFDARQPVRGSRPVPFTLIVSVLLLAGLVVALFLFYRSGVRSAGEAPQVVGAPVGDLKSEATPEAQPADPAAGLQIYRSEDGSSSEAMTSPSFVPPPETPQPRPAPVVVAPPAAAPTTPVGKAQTLAPAAPAAATTPAPTQKAAPAAAAPAAATPAPAPKASPAPASSASASGASAVQIGAFSSQALADRGWSDAVAVSPGLAAGKGKGVERVERDGSTFYRTTVTGFASRTDANAFCSALKAAGKSCFVR